MQKDSCEPAGTIELFGLPASTAAMQILVLEKAGLLHTEMRPGSRELQKL